MPSYDPELIQTMRAALDAVMEKVPIGQASVSIKAALAEFILQTASRGETTFDGLVSAASDQIQTIIVMLT